MADQQTGKSALDRTRNRPIHGISIASFLQILEQEKHTCSVQVEAENRQGVLHFNNGTLIDAEYEHLNGIEAAYAIVSWRDTSIILGESLPSPKRINHPLGYILLNAAKQQDEKSNAMITPKITYMSNGARTDPGFQKTVTALTTIPGIRHFYVLNKAGEIAVHSAPDSSLGELIVYCIITSSNLRKPLQTKSPRQILMQMTDGTHLFIVPKSGKILAMILEPNSSSMEIANRINKELKT